MPTSNHGRSLVELVMALNDRELSLVRATVRAAVKRIEEQRGGEYERATYFKKTDAGEKLAMEMLAVEIARVVGLVARGRTAPTPPLDAVHRHEAAIAYRDQAIWRQKVGADAPLPMKPAVVARYETECATVVEAIRARAEKKGCYWLRAEMAQRIEDHIVAVLGKTAQRVRVQERRAPQRSRVTARFSPLAGDRVDDDESEDEHHRESFLHEEDHHDRGVSAAEAFLSKADARRLLPTLELTFLDDLTVDGVSRSVLERRTESYYHSDHVRSMVGLLRRLGWRVYPGGAGIAGVYAMADLLAIDGDDFLFVECLTKTAVEKFATHLKKRELATHVPFCFVGPVPDEFMRALPSTAYGIVHPSSPTMLNGEWVPHFWRSSRKFVSRFTGVITKGRSITRIRIGCDGLRLAEDVSSFLWVAWTEVLFGHHRKLYEAKSQGWEIRSLRDIAIGHVPFTKHGLSGTVITIKGRGSELALKLGRIPVEAELRGSSAALDLLCEWLELAGFPLQFSS